MKKIKLLLIPCVLFLLLSVPAVSTLLDNIFLMDDNLPGYTKILAQAAVEYPEKNQLESTLAEGEKVDKSKYTQKVIRVNKDGFGLVAPEDVSYLLKLLSHAEPNIKTLTLRFNDATAVQIPTADPGSAVYGNIDDKGNISEVVKNIDLNVPLQNQIDGITNITETWKRVGKKTYHYRYCYDADGVGVADSEGIAGYEEEYEYSNIISVLLSRKNGNLTYSKTLGIDGKPVANPKGYAIVRREYDKDNMISDSYYDADDNPVERIDVHYASASFQYDSDNNCISETYYDQEGNPIIANKGYACIKRQYDKDHRVTREEYYGADMAPLALSKGEAITEIGYDESGNPNEERFYGEDGQPILRSGVYHKVLRQFDEKKKVVREEYFGTDDEPILIPGGYAAVEYGYDEGGNRTTYVYYDCNNASTLTSWNYAKLIRGYDNKGRITREEYYGTDLKPLVQAAGHVAVENEYDDDGNLTARSYIGEDGNPVTRTDGYSKAEWNLDDNGTTWNVSLKDIDGKEIALEGKNLLKDFTPGADGWSQWYTPQYSAINSCLYLGNVNLGNKQEGDVYTCSMEVEFSDVRVTDGDEFGFFTQGPQDGKWNTGNVWDNSLIKLEKAPSDGIYKYESTAVVTDGMADISTFGVGFRCDNWSSGLFRVRNVKIEKGDKATAWNPGI